MAARVMAPVPALLRPQTQGPVKAQSQNKGFSVGGLCSQGQVDNTQDTLTTFVFSGVDLVVMEMEGESRLSP